MWVGTGGGGKTSNLPWMRGFVKYLSVLVVCLRMRPDMTTKFLFGVNIKFLNFFKSTGQNLGGA